MNAVNKFARRVCTLRKKCTFIPVQNISKFYTNLVVQVLFSTSETELKIYYKKFYVRVITQGAK